MTSRSSLFAYATRGSRLVFAVSALSVLIGTAFGQLGPLVLRYTIDTVLGGKSPEWPLLGRWLPGLDAAPWLRDRLWLCGLALLLCALLQALFSYVRICTATMASEDVAKRLRERLYDHINRLPFRVLGDMKTGDLIQRCSSDVETVRLFLESQLAAVVRIVVMLGVSIPIMCLLNIRLTVLSTVLLPVVMAGSVYYFFRVKTLFQASVEAEAEVSGYLQRTLTGIRTVKGFGRESYEIDRFEGVNTELRSRDRRLFGAISVYWGGSACLCMLQIGVVLVAGAAFASSGLISVGTLALFLTYVTMMVWPIRMLGHVLSDAGRTYVSLGRLAEVVSWQTEPATPEAVTPEIHGRIECRDVGVTSADGNPILSGISFSVDTGQTVAILGRTGSGKSSLVHLIPRLVDYTRGQILVDGVDLAEIDRQWIRGHTGIVLQEPFLFSRTVRENIQLGGEDQPEHRMLEAAHIADIHRTVETTFDAGYDTMVGERGVTLSGGQRQRLAIARAVLKDPPILILDDALSAVDAGTDQRIQQSLKARHGRCTTFIVSHRISTLSQADLILVLEDGKIVQSGTHEELAREPGLYRGICDIQNLLARELESPSNGGDR